MRRRAFTHWEAVAILCGIGIIAVIAIPLLTKSRESDHGTPSSRCQSNLKHVALAFKQYIQDYDEKFPFAKNSRSGLDSTDNWIGQLMPYLKSPQVLQCGSDKAASDPKKSSYAYNAWISNRPDPEIKDIAYVILNFEVQANPNNWTQTGAGPQAVSAATRHEGGANYSFVDGHVKWLRPNRVNENQDGTSYTFAVK